MYILSCPFLILYKEIFLCIFLSYSFLILYKEIFMSIYSYLPVPYIVKGYVLVYIFLLTRSSSCKRMSSCVHILTYPSLILYREIFLCTYSYLPVPYLAKGCVLVYIFLLTRSSSCTGRCSCVHIQQTAERLHSLQILP